MPKSFSNSLLKWYRINARDLPWRHSSDPYAIWISEAMLQQTTVKTVIGYYMSWMKIFPDVYSLADASIDKVLKAWQGLGYYNRARNLHKTAGIIIQQFQGEIPSNPIILKTLPGFGPYMSASVASIAFDCRVPLVDANVRRVMMRITNTHGRATCAIDHTILSTLDALMPDKHAGDFNQAMMELGAIICSSQNPKCNMCPLICFCQSFKKGDQELIPEQKKILIHEITAVIGLIKRDNKFLIQQRPEKGLLAGLWEFPGGKVKESDKTLKDALKRELMEEIGQICRINGEFCRVKHYYTTNKVNLIAFNAALTGDNFKPSKMQKWVTAKDLLTYPMPSGSAKIVAKLLNNTLGDLTLA